MKKGGRAIVIVVVAAAAAVIIAALAAIALFSGFTSLAQNSYNGNSGKTYSAGSFNVTVLEDSGSRFLAQVRNNGPTLQPAAAFVVKKGLNENCEPKGIVVANFETTTSSDGQRLVPKDATAATLKGNGKSVTIDSKKLTNLPSSSSIPTGPDMETSIYILKLEPGSVRATDLVQKIDIQKLNNNNATSEQQAFEDCLQKAGTGYPLLLHIKNPSLDSQVYFTLSDKNDGSKQYETTLKTPAQGELPADIFWPPSRDGWLSANFSKAFGPAPAWKDAPPAVSLHVKIVSSKDGQMREFDRTVKLEQPSLSSQDFVELAKGNAIPVYPKYWEIPVDLS